MFKEMTQMESGDAVFVSHKAARFAYIESFKKKVQ